MAELEQAPMTPDRFESLTDAFGSDLGRWPAADREAARHFATVEPSVAGDILERARRLDLVLAEAPFYPPSRELRERIVLAAPAARRRTPRWRWLSGVGLGAGLAAASIAGVVAGLAVAPAVVAPVPSASDGDPADEAIALLHEPPDPAELT